MLHTLKNLVPQSLKNVYHLFLAVLANIWFGFPAHRLKIIGVTGTDGKTTTVQFIVKILEEAGYKVAEASTINFKLGSRGWVNTSKFTTLSSFYIQRFLKAAIKEGCEYVVLETSSHALDQYRVWGIPYAGAVITNVTREHLDYHKTLERYRQTKKRLFKKAAIGIVNLDMDSPEEFLAALSGRKLTYSTRDHQADVVPSALETRLDGSTFRIEDQDFLLHVPGLFNVENALAAITVGVSQSISLPVIAAGLKKIESIPGRMEAVSNNRGIKILIDYAVTPSALEKLYSLVSEMNPGSSSKIIAVFGACGERDRGKRPIMGEIVSSYADSIILTNEDPYHEDPERILNEIAAGIRNKEEKKLFRILDRREAIRKALELAQDGDIVVVTGKGAEETMAIGNQRIPWNDGRVIEEEIQKM